MLLVGKLTTLEQELPVTRQTNGTLHRNAAARKEPIPQRLMKAPSILLIFFNSWIGASARRNRTMDILTRIVVSTKRRLET